MHGWLAAGKSTLLSALSADERLKSKAFVLEHNIEDEQHRDLLKDFYSGKVAPVMWEGWQLFSYYDAVCKGLTKYKDADIVFLDRSFMDVMNFVNIYISNPQDRASFSKAFEPCLHRFVKICSEQCRQVLPVTLFTDPERCWRQFNSRAREDN